VLTSLITTAKALTLDPFTHLRDLFACITGHPKNRLT
jgi:hypothetical protein